MAYQYVQVLVLIILLIHTPPPAAAMSVEAKAAIEKGIEAGKVLAEVLKDGDFRDSLVKLGKNLAPFLGVLGPLARIALSFIPEGVLRRYFTTLYEKDKQMRERKYQTHKKKCGRATRKRDNLTRRTLALEKVKWTTKKIARLAETLREDAMSSEESSYEDDNPTKLKSYTVNRLSWESERFTKAKKDLDKAYKKHLTKRAAGRIFSRTDRGNPSTTPTPEDIHKWAVA